MAPTSPTITATETSTPRARRPQHFERIVDAFRQHQIGARVVARPRTTVTIEAYGADMLLERRCPGCGCAAGSLCDRCLEVVRAGRSWDDELQGAAAALGLSELRFLGHYGVGPNGWVLKRSVLAAKNGRRRDLYRTLVPLLADGIADRPHMVAWVPPSRGRRRARGFDHGQIMAQQLATTLRVPYRRLLARSDGNASVHRSRAERIEGPRLVAVRQSPPRVLLVDDVFTTGGSLASGAAALGSAGAEWVGGAVLAVVLDS